MTAGKDRLSQVRVSLRRCRAWANPEVRKWHSTDLPAAATDVCLLRCSGLDATVALGLFMTDAVEKGFCGDLRATLIQEQDQMRNLDSKNQSPGFVRFNF
jgi:hypothetical protein